MRAKHSRRHARVIYLAGPGDVIGTYRCWADGRDDDSQMHVAYSSLFYDVCTSLGADARVISPRAPRDRLVARGFAIEHCPTPLVTRSGLLYHLGQFISGLRIMRLAVLWRANVVVVAQGTHWFMLRPLAWIGVDVIPALHCMLWPKSRTSGPDAPVRIAKRLFGSEAAAILSASEDISNQVRSLTGGTSVPILRFWPLYRRSTFAAVHAPEPESPRFLVFFAGRIERSKGVFDLLEIAARLREMGRTEIEFDLCGSGGAHDELLEHARQSGLADRFRCHGHCGKERLRRILGRSHVVVVPTRSTFVEGYNQVVVEAVLAGRPVVTSAVCPALRDVESAAVEVAPDEPKGYLNAILQLHDDREFYKSKVNAAKTVSEMFYDPTRSWAQALRMALQ